MIISNIITKILMSIQHIKFGKKCRFRGIPIMVSKNATISLGDNVSVSSGSLSNMIGLYQRTIICARNGGQISIGNNVGMSGVTVYAFKKISIGDYTIIGANVKIFDSDFHPADPDIRRKTPNDKEHTAMRETVIGNNVFIGCNSIILKGVHIGDNSIIGAGSVVTKDIPANCVAAGNPASVIKEIPV